MSSGEPPTSDFGTLFYKIRFMTSARVAQLEKQLASAEISPSAYDTQIESLYQSQQAQISDGTYGNYLINPKQGDIPIPIGDPLPTSKELEVLTEDDFLDGEFFIDFFEDFDFG